MSGPLATMIASQEPGTWMKANVNTFQEVWPATGQRSSPGTGSPRYVISAWSGGGYDPKRGDFYVWGGDNGTYSGNEMYRWSAASLSWQRLSLPSAIKRSGFVYPSGAEQWITVDGVDRAPISGESFDNVVYLPTVDRLAMVGGNAYPGNGLQYTRTDGYTRAGPYFFDPAKGDPNKVGGSTGSQVRPDLYPNVVGGNMWQNRQSIQKSASDPVVGPSVLANGVSAATVIGGKDVIFSAEYGKGGRGRLFKNTINSLNPAGDTWELVGVMGSKTYADAGVGAYDSNRNVFMRTARTANWVLDPVTNTLVKKGMHTFMYWDLDTAGPTNKLVHIHPDSLLGDPLPLTSRFGMDYDPIGDVYYLWSGINDVWALRPPENFGPTGWTVKHLDPGGGPTLVGAKFTGVYGKWNYMPGFGTFMGVAHDLTGDVWIYKPDYAELTSTFAEFGALRSDGGPSFAALADDFRREDIQVAAVPEPATLFMIGAGLFGLVLRRRNKDGY